MCEELCLDHRVGLIILGIERGKLCAQLIRELVHMASLISDLSETVKQQAASHGKEVRQWFKTVALFRRGVSSYIVVDVVNLTESRQGNKSEGLLVRLLFLGSQRSSLFCSAHSH